MWLSSLELLWLKRFKVIIIYVIIFICCKILITIKFYYSYYLNR